LNIPTNNRIKREVIETVDTIFDQATTKWIHPHEPGWLYENVIFNCMQLFVMAIGRPYEHICKAGNLTAILPNGAVAPCYTRREGAWGQT